MKISLLHPSRSRPDKSLKTVNEWLDQAGDVEVELLVSVDLSDPLRAVYQQQYGAQCYEFPSKSVVEATNSIAVQAKGDILVYLSDDFKCPISWGEKLVEQFKNENRPLMLKVHDDLQLFETHVLTIPIMNRLLYQRLGYFWHPDYLSMWVDCDLYETCFRMGAIKNAKHLVFPHHHHSAGKAVNDETYKRSEANWNQGLEMFNKRKLQKFPA